MAAASAHAPAEYWQGTHEYDLRPPRHEPSPCPLPREEGGGPTAPGMRCPPLPPKGGIWPTISFFLGGGGIASQPSSPPPAADALLVIHGIMGKAQKW